MYKDMICLQSKKKNYVAYLIKYAQCCCFFPAENRWRDYASASVYIPDNHCLIAIILVLLKP